MPNLEYDVQNPTDLLGQPIAEGDIVAWGTTYGRSAAICVAEIVKIRFTRQVGVKNVECPQAVAERYTLRLRPIKSTGDVTYVRKDTGKPDYAAWKVEKEDPERFKEEYECAAKTVQHVKNIVKLDPSVVS